MTYVKAICKKNLGMMDECGEEYDVAYYEGRMYSFLVENEDSYVGFDEMDCNPHKISKSYMDEYFDIKCIHKESTEDE